MADRAPQPGPKSGAFQSMLARLRGIVTGKKDTDLPPGADGETGEGGLGREIRLSLPGSDGSGDPEPPVDLPEIPLAGAPGAPEKPEDRALTGPARPAVCPSCQAPRAYDRSFCDACGYVFTEDIATTTYRVPAAPKRIQGRYEPVESIGRRGDVVRYRALDHGDGTGEPVPVVLVRGPAAPSDGPAPADDTAREAAEEILPTFDAVATADPPVTEILNRGPAWPGVGWEAAVLLRTRDSILPAVLDCFSEDGFEYLVEEWPAGEVLREAWDRPAATQFERFGWLQQLAAGLRKLHETGAVFESLRPELVVVYEDRVRVTHVDDLLPVPLREEDPVRSTLYTAPELVTDGQNADVRADLYGLGALVYSLHVGRELADADFEHPGFPKPFLAQFPDAHPLLGRLVGKTFARDPARRFPTDEASREDATGFTELSRTLDACRHTLDHVRLEVGAWTTTGMIRTGNEDTFAVLHAVESRQDELRESALVLLSDGMGGYEAGEVAAAIAIHSLRKYLLQQKLFALLAGESPTQQQPFDLELCQRHLQNALKEANKEVFAAARNTLGRRGMGCTAEAVYLNGRHLVAGHVGDSRTYHLQSGRLTQLTRDQTLVNRLMELGTLTPEEAEKHPRRSELQQAIGGHANVEPALYHALLKPGDWVVVCSDGLSNHVTPAELQETLAAGASAETVARRLVNLTNLKGAHDNATVVVVRVT